MRSIKHNSLNLGTFLQLLICLFIFSSTKTLGQTVNTYTTAGATNINIPAGATNIRIQLWGGGGGGGTSSGKNGSGGGGGGAYVETTLASLVGATYNIFVGGISQDSWFINNTTHMATGGATGGNGSNGAFGAGGIGGQASASWGTLKYSGGNGGNGGTASGGGGGGGGSSAGTSSDGNLGTAASGTSSGIGGIAVTGGGSGGNGGPNNGLQPGGGGGGSVGSGGAPGTGATGKVIITYTLGSNCPASTSIAPSAVQNRCQGTAASLLTATITGTGGSGTYTPRYQWYYNTTNSNTVAGAIKIAGATAQTYTPLTTATEVGTRYYFCVGYATDNTCAQTDATQSLASTVVQVTVSALPTTANAGTTQTLCTNTTILAGNNPTVGTGLWTVISGTATITTTTLYNTAVTNLGSGANVLRWTISNGACTSSTSDVTITNNKPTTPTAGSNQNICGTSVTLAGNTITVGTGTWTRISGSGTITTPSSPTSTVTALGNGNNVFRWTATNVGCTLFSEVTINSQAATPATPGGITGSVAVSPGNLFVYTIATVPFATNYIWTIPAATGWSIVSGQGTTSLTVTAGNTGTSGFITVRSSNTCGTSAASSTALINSIYVPPHTNCNQCHITHKSLGSALTNLSGNANLCLNCHNPVGTASTKSFQNSDKAIPGTLSGKSHSWDVNAVNATYGTQLPTDSQMALRIVSNKIVCSTCHNQHNSSAGSPYLRLANTGDALCKDCHRNRNVGKWVDNNVTNRGSHPVGITYPTWLATPADTLYRATPINGIKTVGGKVECSSCHATHDVTGAAGITNDGYLLRSTNDVNLCKNCHLNYGPHQGNDCLVCHKVHNSGSSNIFMIRNTIATPNSGNKAVVFTARTGTNSFADGDATYNGICEVCHTATAHFKNNSLGTAHTGDASPAVKAGGNCIGCHSHKKAFPKPVSGGPISGECGSCHAVNNAPGFPAKITTNGHGSHPSRSDGLYTLMQNDCGLCHGTAYSTFVTANLPVTHAAGAIDMAFTGLARPFGANAALASSYNTTNKTCSNIYCHSDGRNAYRGQDLSYPTTPQNIQVWSATTGSQAGVFAVTPAWTVAPGTGINTCFPCHNGRGNMVAPYTITTASPASQRITSNADIPNNQKHTSSAHVSDSKLLNSTWGNVQCFWCHETDAANNLGATPKKQGTYGTALHVDGKTHFKPGWFSGGAYNGTHTTNLTYAPAPDGSHCSSGQKCW